VVLNQIQSTQALQTSTAIFEKLDGINVGLCFIGGGLRFVSRGNGFLHPCQLGSSLGILAHWGVSRSAQLFQSLGHEHILFGEFMGVPRRHPYPKMSELFFGFSLWNRNTRRFELRKRLLQCCQVARVATVPLIFKGRAREDQFVRWSEKSTFGGTCEGLVISTPAGNVKWVRADHAKKKLFTPLSDTASVARKKRQSPAGLLTIEKPAQSEHEKTAHQLAAAQKLAPPLMRSNPGILRMRVMQGTPLTHVDQKRALQLGAVLERLHHLAPFRGLPALPVSFEKHVLRMRLLWAQLSKRDHRLQIWGRAIVRILIPFAKKQSDDVQSGSPRLLHGDLKFEHVWATKNGLQLIDFGRSLCGDPAWEIAACAARLEVPISFRSSLIPKHGTDRHLALRVGLFELIEPCETLALILASQKTNIPLSASAQKIARRSAKEAHRLLNALGAQVAPFPTEVLQSHRQLAAQAIARAK
jgi:hypothetical protein